MQNNIYFIKILETSVQDEKHDKEFIEVDESYET